MTTTMLTKEERLAWLKDFFSSEGPGRKLRRLRKGETLFKKGTEAKYVYMIQQGEIILVAPDSRSPEICHPNYWLFEAHELGHCYLQSASALTDCAVMAFEVETFSAMLREHPILHDKFLRDAALRVMAKNSDLPAAKRLASELLLLCDGKDAIEAGPKWIAEAMGISRQRADKILNEFVDDGLLKKLRSGVYLLNKEALEKFARSRNGDHR
jgi:CRP-like cAMP-binding protein